MAAPQPVTMASPVYKFPQPYLPKASASPSSSASAAPTPTPTPAPAPAPPLPYSPRLPEHLMHKNRLQEYTQRSSIPLPVYQTVNEGAQHAPRFRSTVWVDGMSYTSGNTFPHRKAAEQDVAKLAFECISKKIKDEGGPLIQENTLFCKSILNEYAVKLKIDRPTYNTVQQEGGLIPLFVSSLVFNGMSFSGEAARSKKEAEQLAARAVILSVLRDSQSGTILSEIIRSKSKLYAAIQNTAQYLSTGTANMGQLSDALDHKERGVAAPATYSIMHPPLHEFQVSKQEPSTETTQLPIVFVHPTSEQPIDDGSSSKKRKKNKRRANKKSRLDAQPPVSAIPLNQIPP